MGIRFLKEPAQASSVLPAEARPAGWRAAWESLGPEWRLALSLLVVLRLGLELVVALAVWLDPEPDRAPRGNWFSLIIQGGEPWSQLLSGWQRWDALWYQRIALHGYSAGDGSINFYPLYPVLSRIVSLPLGGQVVLGQLVVSSVAFAVAMGLLYGLTRFELGARASQLPEGVPSPTDHRENRLAELTVLLTALFPTGFVLLAPYTESLFLMLTLAACWLARQGRPWAAGLAGLGAALTRTQGVFLVPALAFEYLRQQRAVGTRPGLALLASAGPALGWAGFIGYQQLVVGEQRSAFEVQQYFWGTTPTMPWELIWASLSFIMTGGRPEQASLPAIEALNLACLLGFGLLAGFVLRRLPLMYALYVWPSLGLLAVRWTELSPLSGVARYVLVLFPCFVVLAMLLARRPLLATGWLVVSGILQVQLLWFWVRWGAVF